MTIPSARLKSVLKALLVSVWRRFDVGGPAKCSRQIELAREWLHSCHAAHHMYLCFVWLSPCSQFAPPLPSAPCGLSAV